MSDEREWTIVRATDWTEGRVFSGPVIEGSVVETVVPKSALDAAVARAERADEQIAWTVARCNAAMGDGFSGTPNSAVAAVCDALTGAARLRSLLESDEGRRIAALAYFGARSPWPKNIELDEVHAHRIRLALDAILSAATEDRYEVDDPSGRPIPYPPAAATGGDDDG